jgi:hypothetical protein
MLRRSAPLFVFTLLLGASSPAFADVGVPKEDIPAEEDKGKGSSSGCSVETAKLELASLAAMVLLIGGASLRRRGAEAV